MTTTMTRLLEPLRCKGRQKLYAGRTLRRRELSAIISWPRSAESSVTPGVFLLLETAFPFAAGGNLMPASYFGLTSPIETLVAQQV